MQKTIRTTSGILYAVLIGSFGALHVSWVFGGSLLLSEQRGGPWKNSLPVDIELLAWSGIALMFLAAVLALGRVGLVWRRIPQWFYGLSCWVMTACMFLGVAINFAGHSSRQRLLWGPFWLVLFLLVLAIALPARENR